MADDKRGSTPHIDDQGRELSPAERAMFDTQAGFETWRESLAIMLTEINGRIRDVGKNTVDMIDKIGTKFDLRFDGLQCGQHTAMLSEINRRGSEANAPKLVALAQQIEELERQMDAVSTGSKHRHASTEEAPIGGDSNRRRSPTDPANPQVRRSDLEDFSQRFMVPLAERVAESAAEERVAALEAQRDKMASALESVREKSKQEAAQSAAAIELARLQAQDRKRQFLLKALIGLVSALVGGGVFTQLKCELPARSQQAKPASAASTSRPARDASVFYNGKR